MFMKMLPMAGWFLGMSGKSLVKTGLSTRARALTAPAFSPIFMMPSHRASTPVRPREVSKAVFEVSKVESTILWNIVTSPMLSLMQAMTKAMTKKAIQM